MGKNSIGWLAWVAAGAVVLVLIACGSETNGTDGAVGAVARGNASTDRFGHSPAVPPRVPVAAQVQPFSFLIATHDPSGSGYDLTAVNGAPFGCGRQTAATSCYVSALDLSTFDLSATDAKTILAQVGRDPSAPALLFVGAVSSDALVAQEIWRAPVAAPLTGTVLQVSHQPAQALVVNDWSPSSAGPFGAIDFTSAPKAEHCVLGSDGNQACSMSYVSANTDVVATAGVVLTGRKGSDGALHVQQYFLKVSTGYDDNSDGYSYCAAGQQLCPDNKCYYLDGGSCIGLHWGGRGEISVYVRSTNASVEAWLMSTGQLTPADFE